MIEYIYSLLLALLVTVIIETAVAWLFGLRSKKELVFVILINVITNTLLNYLLLVNANPQLVSNTTALILCLEVCVVLTEWWLLCKYLRLNIQKMLVLSIGMNAVSFLAGLLIFQQNI